MNVLLAMSRVYAPLMMLFGVVLIVNQPPGSGVGFMASLAFALPLILMVLVRGTGAAMRALPPPTARAVLACGLVTAIVGAGAPRLNYAPMLIEAGAFLASTAAMALIVTVLSGRVPAMLNDGKE